MNDTNLELGSCATASSSTCLLVTSTVTQNKEILISVSQNVCNGLVIGRRLEVIGDHVNDPLQEVAVLYCENPGTASPPALAVVDVSSGQVVARAIAPSEQVNSFTDYPRDPEGRKYPFLAPSYGDGDTSFYAHTVWGYLCLYKPDRRSDAKCGNGFVAVSTTPADKFFREVGGYLHDLDSDGWEDITLIFHKQVYTISTRTAAEIGTTEYDVAEATEPKSPKWFHDGRNYGTHSVVTGTDGKLRTVMVGGMPVGSFANVTCGVSWFAAVLEMSPGQPSTRKLRWSRYYGFSSNVFSEVNVAFAADPSVRIARLANYQNGCVHTFSDSRSIMDREHVIIFNYFREEAPQQTCIKEQYQLYLDPAWTLDKQQIWHTCIAMNRTAPGMWNMQVLRERDGIPLAESRNVYIWGASRELLPNGEMVYLVESLPQRTVPFDLGEHAPSPLLIRALNNGQWSERGTLPVARRPNIQLVGGSGSRGCGSYNCFAELVLKDIDGDGIKDIQMADGTWIGYSTRERRFIPKAP